MEHEIPRVPVLDLGTAVVTTFTTVLIISRKNWFVREAEKHPVVDPYGVGNLLGRIRRGNFLFDVVVYFYRGVSMIFHV